jgi:hypothetical protein
MSSSSDPAMDLLRRLLSGERQDVPLYLACLLEKTSPLDSGEDYYRDILPPELADIRLPAEQAREIIESICAEVSSNPDPYLIFAVSSTGAPVVTTTLCRLLTAPPRPLSMAEYASAFAYVSTFLPIHLAEDSKFLLKADLKDIARLVAEFEQLKEAGVDRSERISVKLHAHNLLNSLNELGIVRNDDGPISTT